MKSLEKLANKKIKDETDLASRNGINEDNFAIGKLN
jgi:hypothetical protein